MRIRLALILNLLHIRYNAKLNYSFIHLTFHNLNGLKVHFFFRSTFFDAQKQIEFHSNSVISLRLQSEEYNNCCKNDTRDPGKPSFRAKRAMVISTLFYIYRSFKIQLVTSQWYLLVFPRLLRCWRNLLIACLYSSGACFLIRSQ